MRRVSLRAVGTSAHQVDMWTGPVNTTCMSICRSSMSAICTCGSRNCRKPALGGSGFLPKARNGVAVRADFARLLVQHMGVKIDDERNIRMLAGHGLPDAP